MKLEGFSLVLADFFTYKMAGFVPFCDKSSILISGASQSGKTLLLRDILICAEHMFQTLPTVCLFLYSHWQQAYEDIREKWGDRILFTQRTPKEEEVEELMSKHKHGRFVADDQGDHIEKSVFFRSLLCRLGHHCRMSTFCLLQDENLSSRTSSVLKKNFHVSIILRSPRERSFVRSIGMQTGDYQCVMEAYDDVRKEKYGYICIDLHPAADPDLKYRTNIVPNATRPCVVYRPKCKRDP